MPSIDQFYFFNDTTTTEIYTFPYTTLFRSVLPLHIARFREENCKRPAEPAPRITREHYDAAYQRAVDASVRGERSEEHTSELQSQSNLVCRLLLEKKKKQNVPLGTHRSCTV